MQIAIVLYPGLTALDAIGPYEVLRLLPDADVRFVAGRAGPVVRRQRRAVPRRHPQLRRDARPDLVLVPGSGPRTATNAADTERPDGFARCTRRHSGRRRSAPARIWPPPASWTAARDHPLVRAIRTGRARRPAPARRADRPRRQGGHRSRRVGRHRPRAVAGRRIAGRQRAETVQLYIEYDPHPPFDAGNPSKASATVLADAKALSRKIAVSRPEGRAIATLAWRRTYRPLPSQEETVKTPTVDRRRAAHGRD